MKILILDDEPKSAFLSKILLEKLLPEGAEICLVHTIEACKDWLSHQKPDLLLLDIKVNGKSSFDFLEHFGPLDFPVTVTSASKSYAYQAYECGFQGYLLKPLDSSELFKVLSRLKVVFH